VNQDTKQRDYQVNWLKCGENMKKLYKILETDGSVIRIFSYKEEAEKFLSLDRTLRIETIKVFKQKLKDNVYIKAYTVLGDSIL
jgi:hypothetical protein